MMPFLAQYVVGVLRGYVIHLAHSLRTRACPCAAYRTRARGLLQLERRPRHVDAHTSTAADLLGASNTIASLTQLRHRFVLYSVSPLLYNLGIIFGAIVLYPIWGVAGLGLGSCIWSPDAHGGPTPVFHRGKKYRKILARTHAQRPH